MKSVSIIITSFLLLFLLAISLAESDSFDVGEVIGDGKDGRKFGK